MEPLDNLLGCGWLSLVCPVVAAPPPSSSLMVVTPPPPASGLAKSPKPSDPDGGGVDLDAPAAAAAARSVSPLAGELGTEEVEGKRGAGIDKLGLLNSLLLLTRCRR